jgi:hypothetical protein
MSEVGFEPTIPAFEREKTVHALDRAATVIGLKSHTSAVFVNKYTKLGRKSLLFNKIWFSIMCRRKVLMF